MMGPLTWRSRIERRQALAALGGSAIALASPNLAVGASGRPARVRPERVPGIIAFWRFQEPAGAERKSLGPTSMALQEPSGPVERVQDGLFGPYSLRLSLGQWLTLPRHACGALDRHGSGAQVTVVAWVKRERKQTQPKECEAIAGLWNETRALRQYCLFLNLQIYDSSDQVCGHVSSVGGPTPGQRYCMDASIGRTPVACGSWQCVGFTYDGRHARSYLNGVLDRREGRNPYAYEGGLFDGGAKGSDFTVGAVDRSGEMGNWFQGQIGGLAVYGRALSDVEMAGLASAASRP
jgi:hypothetical protein